MRLLILTEYFYPDKSSTPKVLTELAEDLIEYGIDVSVITSTKSYKNQNDNLLSNETYKGIKIKRIRSSGFNRDNYLGRILNYITFVLNMFIKLIFKSDYDMVLVVSNPPLLPIISYIIRRIKKKKYIYLVHDIYPDIAVKVGAIKQGGIVYKIMDFINSKVYRYSEKIIVLGDDMKEFLLRKNVDMSKLIKITNWADSKKIYRTSKENDFSVKYSIQKTFNIVYTGNIGRFHNIELILEVANYLRNDKEINFIFVGDGYKKKVIEKYILDKKLDNIKLFDYCYSEEYNQVLNTADVFISTLDKGIEGLGVPSKTYSYLAIGKPIIAIMNKNSEIGNLVIENDIGIVEESDNVIRIVDFIKNIKYDHKLYCDFSNNAYNLFKSNYDRKVVTKKFDNLIRSV